MTTENIKEQPVQQEPFGYFHYDLRLDAWVQNRAGLTGTPFYTSPPAQRKPLTDEEIINVAKSIDIEFKDEGLEAQIDDILTFARAIEAKLKENT